MNITLRAYWNNNPIPVNKKIENPQFVIRLPLGAIINSGVTSVNGHAGAVTLNAADIGAATEAYVNQQISQIPDAPVTSVNDKTGAVVLTASDVGATTQAYVDQQDAALLTQIGTKADAIAVTQALSTKADLVGGVIPANQLPSYVDDVLEYASWASFPVTGEAGKIYIALDVNKTYRWGGSGYVEIGGGGVALGETAATAYRGDRGKIAYDHSQSQGNPHNTTTSEITEGLNKFFTEARVRNTVLSGLVKTNSSNVTNADTVEVAVGKLAAKSESGSRVINWVNANTLSGYSKHNNLTAASTRVQFAVIDGFIWMRGYITLASSMNANLVLFSFTDSRFLWDNTFLGSTADNQFTYDRKINQNIKAQDTFIECKFIAKQVGTGTPGNITNTFQIIVGANITADINFAIIEPVCIGIAKNP